MEYSVISKQKLPLDTPMFYKSIYSSLAKDILDNIIEDKFSMVSDSLISNDFFIDEVNFHIESKVRFNYY